MLMTNFLAGDAGRDGAIVAHVANFGGVFLEGVVSRIEAPCGQFRWSALRQQQRRQGEQVQARQHDRAGSASGNCETGDGTDHGGSVTSRARRENPWKREWVRLKGFSTKRRKGAKANQEVSHFASFAPSR
jgi:hypothetical protein